jgi:hypothetical protein
MLTGWILLFSWGISVVFRRTNEMSEKRPSTSVHMRYAENLPFPAITVCNMATQVPLETMWCGSYVSNETTRCVAVIPPGMPHCLTFNNHLNGSVYTTEKTGLADTLMISLRIKRKDYPPTARFVGVHVSLHPQCQHGKDCPEELSNVLLASPGQPKFFRMRRLTLQYLNGTSETQFEARDTISSVTDFNRSFGDTQDTVVMGFHFSSLAETLITELPSYNMMDLGAELGGIMGLVFGTGAFDVLLHVIRWCAGRGSFYHDLTARHPSAFRSSTSPTDPDDRDDSDDRKKKKKNQQQQLIGEGGLREHHPAYAQSSHEVLVSHDVSGAAAAAASEGLGARGGGGVPGVAADETVGASVPVEQSADGMPCGGLSRWSRRGSTIPRGCAWLDELLGACCPRQFYASRTAAAEEDLAGRLFVTSGRALPWHGAGAGMPVIVRGQSVDVLTEGPGAERAGWWALFCCCAILTVREVDTTPKASGVGGEAVGGRARGRSAEAEQSVFVESVVSNGEGGAGPRGEDEDEDDAFGEERGVRRPLLARTGQAQEGGE